MTYDSVDKLKTGAVTELPVHPSLYPYVPKQFLQSISAVFGLWFEEGVFDYKPARFLNEVFPEIKPLKIKEMLDTAWKA